MMDIFFPIQKLADSVVFNWLGLTPTSYMGGVVDFFIYDVIKIGLLLMVINYIMAITRYYFPIETAKNLLTKRKWFGLDYLLAAGLGVVTPFCSCSSIPLFIGFLKAGIPLGVTIAFLISSPLVNEASLYIFPAVFGWKITLIYNLVGLGVAVGGGMILEKLNMIRFVRREFLELKSTKVEVVCVQKYSFISLSDEWRREAIATFKSVFPYVIIGVGVGALIHGLVPVNFVSRYLITNAWWSVPVAALIGAPIYANSISIIPIMEVLVAKGMSVGTVLAFMTGTVTLSVPEALMLSKVMRWPLLAVFFGITIVGIMIMGWIINWVS